MEALRVDILLLLQVGEEHGAAGGQVWWLRWVALPGPLCSHLSGVQHCRTQAASEYMCQVPRVHVSSAVSTYFSTHVAQLLLEPRFVIVFI